MNGGGGAHVVRKGKQFIFLFFTAVVLLLDDTNIISCGNGVGNQ
jgi:hypothetical protein